MTAPPWPYVHVRIASFVIYSFGIGSGTFIPLLARRFLAYWSEDEYRTRQEITMVDFDMAGRECAVSSEGMQQFTLLFCLTIGRDGNCIELPQDPFVTQVLWTPEALLGWPRVLIIPRGLRDIETVVPHSSACGCRSLYHRENREVSSSESQSIRMKDLPRARPLVIDSLR
jgi:hypothetical protein